jgi:hypothetical protein
MGRPPVGKAAMTSTERPRRYRAGAMKPATKPGPRGTVSVDIDVLTANLRPLAKVIREQSQQHIALISTITLLRVALDIDRLLEGRARGETVQLATRTEAGNYATCAGVFCDAPHSRRSWSACTPRSRRVQKVHYCQ